MAWERLKLRQPDLVRHLLRPGLLSVAWVVVVIAAAWLTNFDEPYLPFAMGGALVFFLRATPSRWEIYAWLFTSALFVKIIHLSQIPFWLLRVSTTFGVLGFGAILLLGLRALWSDRVSRANALALLAPALILVLFIFTSAQVLRFSGGLNPQTDDAWLYAFDGSLGFQPSFAMGRVMFDSIVLARSASLTYLSLPFAMAVVCAWQIPLKATRISWHMLTVLLLAGVSGWLLYNVVPGTGPLYAFGRDFPWGGFSYRDLPSFALEKMSISAGIPRNAMPSLHMGWVVLLFWNRRGVPRLLRAVLLLYLCLTVVATLGTGQHYLVDLIVSLPFALAVQSAAAFVFTNFVFTNKARRGIALVAGVGGTAGWLLLIRFGVPLALKSPYIPWSLMLATALTTFWLESWIWRSDSAAENVPALRANVARNVG